MIEIPGINSGRYRIDPCNIGKKNSEIMKKFIAVILAFLLCAVLIPAGCGGKKEEPVPETSLPPVEEDTYEKKDVTMEVAKDDALRALLNAFDPFTDGGSAGSMEYDFRDTISVRRLMDCLFGQRCCANYGLYPVGQPTTEGDVFKVPEESFRWVAEKIFHVPSNDVADYIGASPALTEDGFAATITKNINGVQWYYSDFNILKADYDGTYYYVRYKRNHDDPSGEGDVYQKEYYAVISKDSIDGQNYWTLLTHSSNGFNYVVVDENLLPDVVFDTEKELIINTETPVTMRLGPSTEYGAVASYSPGVMMYGVGTKGDWTYVHYYDHYGWIFSEFLTEQ